MSDSCTTLPRGLVLLSGVWMAAVACLPIAGTSTGPTTVSGRVLDADSADGKGLSGVTVTLQDSAQHSQVAPTDADGKYLFQNVPTGKVNLSFVKLRYVINPTVRSRDDVDDKGWEVDDVLLMKKSDLTAANLSAAAKNMVAAVQRSAVPAKQVDEFWSLIRATDVTIGQTSALAKEIGLKAERQPWNQIPSFAAYSAADTGALQTIDSEFKSMWLKEGPAAAVNKVAASSARTSSFIVADLFRKSLDDPTASGEQKKQLFKEVSESKALSDEVKLKFVDQFRLDSDKIRRFDPEGKSVKAIERNRDR